MKLLLDKLNIIRKAPMQRIRYSDRTPYYRVTDLTFRNMSQRNATWSAKDVVLLVSDITKYYKTFCGCV